MPTAPLHILHVTPYYAPAWEFGGVVSAVSDLASAQAAAGHQVIVLTTDALVRHRRNHRPHETMDGVRVIRCRNLLYGVRARLNFSTAFGMWGALSRLSPPPEVIHTHELRTTENLLLAWRGRTPPIVLSPHGTLPYGTGRGGLKRGWDACFGRLLLRRIAHVAALTAQEAAEAQQVWSALGVPFPGVTVIPNGVTVEASDPSTKTDAQRRAFRKQYGLGDGRVVLFLGRLHERKGLQFLIPAFAAATAATADPPTYLVIAGPDDGMLATAKAITAQHGVSERVIFTGMLTGHDKRAVLMAADAFALPAVGEGLSMAVLEALAAGIPLVVTPGCNFPDVEERGAGLLVEREVGAIAAALQTLLSDPARCHEMGKRGRAWAQASFAWLAIVGQLDALYRQLLEDPTYSTAANAPKS